MVQEIIPIELKLPYRMGSVNCYLVKTTTGFILVDTGSPNKCRELEKNLQQCGCNSENLYLIVLTHGDFDHTGNAAYIKKKYHTKIAMHAEDSQMVERGDMFLNRKKGNFFQSWIVKTLFGFGKTQRFKPDLYLMDGDDLSEYGFDARVLYIPGHSKGSIGMLTVDNDLFCGDLFESTDKPGLNPIMDDLTSANTSVKKLNKLSIKTVYPGHGKSFPMEVFINSSR